MQIGIVKMIIKPGQKKKEKIILFISLIFLSLINCATSIKTYENKVSTDSRIHNSNPNTYCTIDKILSEFKDVGEVGIVTQPDGSAEEVLSNITFDNYGYFNVAKYLGEYRNIDSMKLNLLNGIFKSIGANGLIDKYKIEVFLNIDGLNFWFPLQDTLVNFWKEEIKKDDNVIVYFRIFGAINRPPESKWLFCIHRFDSSTTDGLWNEAMEKFNEGDLIMGEEIIKKSIKINPEDGRNYSVLAFNYANEGKKLKDKERDSLFNLSESYFTKSTSYSPEYSYQYFQWAILKFFKSEYDKAWELIDKAKSLKEENIDINLINDLEAIYPYEKYKKIR